MPTENDNQHGHEVSSINKLVGSMFYSNCSRKKNNMTHVLGYDRGQWYFVDTCTLKCKNLKPTSE